jgi:hypothetical protein
VGIARNTQTEVERASDLCPCGCAQYYWNCETNRTAEEKARAYRNKFGLEGAYDKKSDPLFYVEEVAVPDYIQGPPAQNILVEANQITGNGGDRNDSYDHPRHNFGKIAEVWTTLLKEKLKDNAAISDRDVARLMIGMKLVRDTHKPQRDNILDIAGYARCAERLSENV